MPDIDSLYPQAPQSYGPKPIDPFQIIGAMNALNQNALFQKEFAAKQATGQILQNALNPDGTVDLGKAATALRGNPAAAWAMPETVNSMLEQRQKMIANTSAAFDLKARQNGFIASRIAALADMKNPTMEDVRSLGADLSRGFSENELPSELISGWIDSNRGLTSAQLKQRGGTYKNIAAGAAAMSQRDTGPPNPMTGQPRSISLGQANYGGGNADGIPSAMQPGGSKSSDVMLEDLGRARNFGQEVFPLQQALDAANSLKAKYGTGYFAPGSKGRQEFQSYFYGISPTVSRWLGVDPEKLQKYSEADKYLTQAMQSRASNFGSHTDQALATAISGSPNVNVNDMAVEDVLKSSIALRRAEHAQTLAASKAGGPNYVAESARWPAQHDIRAFAIDLMSPEARAKLLGSMKKGSPEYTKFNNSLRDAYESGVISRPTSDPPPASGARKAPDGNWYVNDPLRQGKYLRLKPPLMGN